MVDFRNTIDFLQSIHFYDVVLPFLLIYAITYGILSKSRIFKVKGEDENKNNISSNENSLYSVIALVFALIVIGSLQTVLYLEGIIINIIVFLVFILTVLMALGFVFGESWNDFFYTGTGDNKIINKWVVIPTVLIILAIVTILGLKALDLWDPFIDFFNVSSYGDTITQIIVFALIGGVLYFITRNTSNDKENENDNDNG